MYKNFIEKEFDVIAENFIKLKALSQDIDDVAIPSSLDDTELESFGSAEEQFQAKKIGEVLIQMG